jgi:hypothetical protein
VAQTTRRDGAGGANNNVLFDCVGFIRFFLKLCQYVHQVEKSYFIFQA